MSEFAYDNGFAAGKRGDPIQKNPYLPNAADLSKYVSWQRGWLSAVQFSLEAVSGDGTALATINTSKPVRSVLWEYSSDRAAYSFFCALTLYGSGLLDNPTPADAHVFWLELPNGCETCPAHNHCAIVRAEA